MKKSAPVVKQPVFRIASRAKLLVAALAYFTVSGIACQKQFSIGEKSIVGFQLRHMDGELFGNEQLATKIMQDSIFVQVTKNAEITKALCKITYVGDYVAPQQNLAQDYSKPVCYSVSGGDGTAKMYVVVVSRAQ